jgi:hypothetical protein
MASWFAEESDYQQTTGLELQFSRSGYLQIQTPNNELVSYDFVGWWYWYSSSTNFRWWDPDGLLAASNDSNSEADLLNQLQYINLEQDEYPGEGYYLMLPKLEENPFIEIDGIYIEADGDDPLYDEGLFSQFLKSGYELVGIQDAELGISDLLNSATMNQQVDVIGDNQLLNNPDAVASTPEPSSAVGVLAIGVVLLAAMVKRGCASLLK